MATAWRRSAAHLGRLDAPMRFAYIATTIPIEAAAELIREVVLPGCEIEERDGLNIGGGQYFRLRQNDTGFVLCWSEQYASPPSPRFTYCAYVSDGPEEELDRLASKLSAHGVETLVEEE